MKAYQIIIKISLKKSPAYKCQALPSGGWGRHPADKKRQSFNRPITKPATGRYKPVNVLIHLDLFDAPCPNTLHKVACAGLPSGFCYHE